MRSINPIKAWRKSRKLTLAKAGVVLGCSAALVSHIEQERRGISADNAQKWEPILGIPKEQLVFSVTPKPEMRA